MPTHPKTARVLFDEAHSEAWTIDPERRASEMQPAHPADSSLARRPRPRSPSATSRSPRTRAGPPRRQPRSRGADVLVIAHPSDPRWEATTGAGSPRPRRRRRSRRSSAGSTDGGGLIVLGETEQEKYGNNLNELLARFGIEIETRPCRTTSTTARRPSWVLAELDRPERAPPGEPTRSPRVETRRASTGRHARDSKRRPRDRPHLLLRELPGAPLAAVTEHGAGRVAVLADSDLFGDDCIGELDHEALWLNLAYWAAGARVRRRRRRRAAARSPPIPTGCGCKTAVEELRLRQEPDGSVDTAAEDASGCASWSRRSPAPRSALKPALPPPGRVHRRARRRPRRLGRLRLRQARLRPLRRGVPARARARATGSSTSSSSPCTSRTRSPRHLLRGAARPRSRGPSGSQSSKRRATTTPSSCRSSSLDYTAGYDSECAVLFPETFSYAERPPRTTSARSSATARRSASAASAPPQPRPCTSTCRPTPPRSSPRPELSRDAYILWDLVHDRTHMRGDLPFDPFMIRQRSPYWMYSLEELRCDLTAFGEAVKLERGGLRVRPPRAVRDPLRPPVPLPAHRQPRPQLRRPRRPAPLRLPPPRGLRALDRQPAGDRVGRASPRASSELRERVQELYHSGIDRSKLGQWTAAHDLVAEYVAAGRVVRVGEGAPPAARGRRSPRSWSTSSATTSSRSASSTRSSSRSCRPALERPARAAAPTPT